MSGPRKSIQSKKNDVQLVVSCQTLKSGSTERCRTSVYEIDIHGALDFHKQDVKEGYGEAAEEAAEKGLSRFSFVFREGKAEDDIGNPFVGEYYPTLKDQPSSQSQNVNVKVQAGSLADDKKGREKKNTVERARKKRERTPADGQLKSHKKMNHIIENFMGEKNSEVQTTVKKYEDELDVNEFHLHQHEHHHHHHHHYYAGGKGVGGDNVPPQKFVRQELGAPPEVSYSPVVLTIISKEGGKHFVAEESHFYGSGRISDEGESFRPSTEISGKRRERPASEGASKEGDRPLSESDSSLAVADKTSLKNIRKSVSSLKVASFVDLTYAKNLNCGTVEHEESNLDENLKFQGLRTEKKEGDRNYDSLMESFKNFGRFMSPMVITDKKSVPKILYITCDCPRWKEKMRPPEEIDVYAAKSSEEAHYVERITCDGGNSKVPKTGESLNFVPQKNEATATEELRFEAWTAMLKEELKEIKNQLKRIGDKRMQKNESADESPRNETSTEGSNSAHRITVYSSKTFILQPKDATPENSFAWTR